MPSPIMRDDAIAMLAKEQHLRVPVVTAERPTVGEDDGLASSPILVKNCGIRRLVLIVLAYRARPCCLAGSDSKGH